MILRLTSFTFLHISHHETFLESFDLGVRNFVSFCKMVTFHCPPWRLCMNILFLSFLSSQTLNTQVPSESLLYLHNINTLPLHCGRMNTRINCFSVYGLIFIDGLVVLCCVGMRGGNIFRSNILCGWLSQKVIVKLRILCTFSREKILALCINENFGFKGIYPKA